VKPTEATVEVNGTPRHLRGEEFNRWKYQRYMRDYLACVQSVDDNVGRLLDYSARTAWSATRCRLHQRPGLLSRRSRVVRQAFHVRESLRMPFLSAGRRRSGRDHAPMRWA